LLQYKYLASKLADSQSSRDEPGVIHR
jgi:hypothetical protein